MNQSMSKERKKERKKERGIFEKNKIKQKEKRTN